MSIHSPTGSFTAPSRIETRKLPPVHPSKSSSTKSVSLCLSQLNIAEKKEERKSAETLSATIELAPQQKEFLRSTPQYAELYEAILHFFDSVQEKKRKEDELYAFIPKAPEVQYFLQVGGQYSMIWDICTGFQKSLERKRKDEEDWDNVKNPSLCHLEMRRALGKIMEGKGKEISSEQWNFVVHSNLLNTLGEFDWEYGNPKDIQESIAMKAFMDLGGTKKTYSTLFDAVRLFWEGEPLIDRILNLLAKVTLKEQIHWSLMAEEIRDPLLAAWSESVFFGTPFLNWLLKQERARKCMETIANLERFLQEESRLQLQDQNEFILEKLKFLFPSLLAEDLKRLQAQIPYWSQMFLNILWNASESVQNQRIEELAEAAFVREKTEQKTGRSCQIHPFQH